MLVNMPTHAIIVLQIKDTIMAHKLQNYSASFCFFSILQLENKKKTRKA